MKFLLFSLISLLLVALLAIGFFELYDSQFQTTTKSDEKPTIEFIDKKDLHIESPKCTKLAKEIHDIIGLPQACNSHTDCSQLKFNGLTYLNVLNHQNVNHLKYQINQECSLSVQAISIHSPPATNLIKSHAECINNICTSVLNLSPTVEIQKILNEYTEKSTADYP